MKKPEMILFDFGNTLLYEVENDPVRGERAAFEYIVENPDNVTPEAAAAFDKEIFGMFREAHRLGFEIPYRQMLKGKYERLGITFSIGIEELESVLWENARRMKPMPHVAEMLDFLHENGIRTGVISTLSRSGQALEHRFSKELSNNRFEFVMTSSEYGVQKPNPLLFETALKKAKLAGDKVWYCGDNIKADVHGSHAVGMFPVLYEGEMEVENPWAHCNDGVTAECEYLHIHDWREMIEVLKALIAEEAAV